MSRATEPVRILLFALLVALVLTLLPLPVVLEPLRPYWVALVLMYWAMEINDPLPLGAVFLTGLVLDLFTATLLGFHAFSLVVLVYLVRHFRARMRFFPAWQQAMAVLALLLNDRIILLWATTLLGDPLPTWRYWIAPLVGTALWPWVFLALDRARVVRRQAGKG